MLSEPFFFWKKRSKSLIFFIVSLDISISSCNFGINISGGTYPFLFSGLSNSFNLFNSSDDSILFPFIFLSMISSNLSKKLVPFCLSPKLYTINSSNSDPDKIKGFPEKTLLSLFIFGTFIPFELYLFAIGIK